MVKAAVIYSILVPGRNYVRMKPEVVRNTCLRHRPMKEPEKNGHRNLEL
jgi:hypothetical protein